MHSFCDRAFRKAADEGHLGIVRLLYDEGADINASDVLGESGALCRASGQGYVEIVEFLLSKGAKSVPLALREACEAGYVEIVEMLLGTDLDIPNMDAHPLVSSAYGGHTRIVELLLEHGADVHAANDSAICWAASNGDVETAKALISHGADVRTMDDTPFHWALENDRYEVIRLLIKHYPESMLASLFDE